MTRKRAYSIAFLLSASPALVCAQDADVADVIATAPEMLQSVDAIDVDKKHAAVDAANDVVMSMSAERTVRWTPVALDPFFILANPQNRGSLTKSLLKPRSIIKLSPFPDVSFTAKNTEFIVRDYSISWFGEIIGGASGTVRINTLLHWENCTINIVSDVGNFNIAPTETADFHVAMEPNMWFTEPIDSPN